VQPVEDEVVMEPAQKHHQLLLDQRAEGAAMDLLAEVLVQAPAETPP